MEERHSDKKRQIYTAAAGILLALALVCAGFAWKAHREQSSAGEVYEEIRDQAKSGTGQESSAQDPVPTEPDNAAESSAEEPSVQIPVDFAALQSEYPDIYAWITVPGTNIDYPVVQREGDNAYYLSHNAAGEESPEGAIFTEDYNTKTFEDPNTVLYGHNMKNGSMFQNLHSYSDRQFFDEHRDAVVYLPDKILHYRIFAAYLYDSRHLLESFDFSDPAVMENYLNSIQSLRDMNANIDTQIELDGSDKVITLSTCYQGRDDKRFLVQAVLESIEQ